MFKLTDKRVGTLLWILENRDKKWSIYELSKDAGTLDYSATHTFVKELEKAGFVIKTRGKYGLSNAPALVQALSVSQPFRPKEKEHFFITGDMKAKMNVVKHGKLEHGFTLFSAGELLFPYVRTEEVHVYARKEEFEKWKKYLIKKDARRAVQKEANLTLILVDQDYHFRFSRKIHGYMIVPIGEVLSDLYSYGGLGEEQAKLIQKEWLKGRLNV